jgi:hypothetical protein
VATNRIAKWDGSSWATLGSGLTGSTSSGVYALTVFDDGTGPALYAGGKFTFSAGCPSVNRIAKWNGSCWAALGSGMNGEVNALTTFDDGNGPALYAGGNFTTAGGASANNVARWNGASWTPLGSGMNGPLRALGVFDDGSGAALYAGGYFNTAGGMSALGIAQWSDGSWAALGSGFNSGAARALTVFNDRTGPALYAGGDFSSTPDSGDSYLAKWGFLDTTPPSISCPTNVVVYDAASSAGKVVTFAIAADDEEDPTPTVVCVPPSGSFFPRGTTTVTCTATDFSGNQSTCQFTVSVHSKVREL